MVIPRRGTRRTGASLISALVSLIIFTTAMTIVLQTYTVGAKTVGLVAQRNAVTLALEAQLERLQAAGYGSLPVVGTYPILPDALPVLEGVSGELAVAPGPLPNTRQLTARVTWESGGHHQEQLAMLVAERGMNP